MQFETGIIAVDWGTTHRRIYAIGRDGNVDGHARDDKGIVSIAPAEFPQAIDDMRRQFGDRPLLLAGMVGSSRGWIEAPYLACPVDLDMLVAAIVRIDRAGAFIVPGLSYVGPHGADVMRGEEVQVLGAGAAGWLPAGCGICHPGTHAKWVMGEAGAVAAFRTVMTGELFALLRTHSILAEQLDAEVRADDAFVQGVRRGLQSADLSADIFGIRAEILLDRMQHDEGASYASGLLIGNDVRTGLGFVGPDRPIALIGDCALTRFYAAALGEVGRDHVEIGGEEAFLAGIKAIAERLS